MKSLYYKLGRLIIKEHFTYDYIRSIYKKQEENKKKLKKN